MADTLFSKLMKGYTQANKSDPYIFIQPSRPAAMAHASPSSGMPLEFIQELWGDMGKEAIDIYDHIDKKELRESYLAHIPQLGI